MRLYRNVAHQEDNMLRTVLARLVGKKFAPPYERQRSRGAMPRPGVTFRPLERLEERETPALFSWTGAVNADFDNPLNWLPQDEGMPGGPPSESRAPLAGDDLIFAPTLPETPWGDPVSRPCTNMHAANGGDLTGAYNSVTLTSDYASIVTLVTGFTTRAFTLAGGSIKQDGAGREITVTSSFNWTGGILNSSTYTSTVNILGNGSIAPLDYGTITTGARSTSSAQRHRRPRRSSLEQCDSATPRKR